MNECLAVDVGLIGYGAALDLQRRLVSARKAGSVPDVFLLCEHPHVITLGRNAKREHVHASDPLLRQMFVEVHATDRGGDVTYHGPGQVIGYPVLNLGAIRRDVAWYVSQLEEIMIRTSATFGVTSRRVAGRRGIWVDVTDAGEEKLGAIGVHISQWITSHGFAYNVSTDLRYFDLIVPCGIPERRPTSLERLLGRQVGVAEVSRELVAQFENVFECAIRSASREELEECLRAHERTLVTEHA